MADYLIHFNGRHDKKGRFTFGDGDGDGQINDRANRKQTSEYEWKKKNIYEYNNGTLTPAGSRRYQEEIRSNRQKSKKNQVDEDALRDPNKWIKDDLKTGVDLARASKDASTATSNLTDKLFKTKPNQRLDLSKMSDNEIRNLINRENLELQYNDMFNKPKENKGKKFVKTALDINSTVAETAIAGLTIATLAVGLYAHFKG